MLNRMRIRALRTLVLVMALMAGLIVSVGPVSAGTDTVCFRILHASPDAPNIDVYVSNTRVATNLAYTKFGLGPYGRGWRFARNDLRVRVYAAGGDPGSPAIRDVTIRLDIGPCYVIVIGNFLQVLEVFTLQDPPVPPTGQFTIRLAHLAPGIGPLDLTKSDGTPLIGGVVFKVAAPTTQNAGAYALQVKQSGGGALLLDLGTRTFRSRERQTVYVFQANAVAKSMTAAAAGPGVPQLVPVIAP